MPQPNNTGNQRVPVATDQTSLIAAGSSSSLFSPTNTNSRSLYFNLARGGVAACGALFVVGGAITLAVLLYLIFSGKTNIESNDSTPPPATFKP